MKSLVSKNRNLLLWLMLASVVIFVNSCVVDPDHHGNHHDNNNYSASEDFTYRFETANRSEFRISAINGTVEITGVSNLSQVEVWGERKVESDSRSDAWEHLDLLTVQVDSMANGLAVRTIQPSHSDGRNYLVYYHIRIPRNWKVDGEQVNGNFRVSSLADDGAANPDSLIPDLQVSVLNGLLVLEDLKCSVTAALVNGNISGNLELPFDGQCDLKVTNGLITLSIPINTSAIFSAATVNGTVQVNGLTLHDLQSGTKYVNGRLGNGRGRIELSDVNGNILVSGYN